jgi:hypothetical protein
MMYPSIPACKQRSRSPSWRHGEDGQVSIAVFLALADSLGGRQTVYLSHLHIHESQVELRIEGSATASLPFRASTEECPVFSECQGARPRSFLRQA